MLADKNKTHSIKFFFIERGGYGSSCYTQFTFPNANTALLDSDGHSAQLEPKVKKTVEGDETDASFGFQIQNISTTNGVIMPTDKICTVNGSDTGSFKIIQFTEPGTYQFEITEINTKMPGFTYDENTWILTVEVTGEGTSLDIGNVSYSSSDGTKNNAEYAEFVNVYKMASFVPCVTKECINGYMIPDNDSKTFNFTITPITSSENIKLPNNDGMNVSINGTGTAEFGEFKFSRTGTYQFKITENEGSMERISYDKSTWTLTVNVTQSGNSLIATGTYSKEDGTTGDSALFVNIYDPGEVLLPNTGGIGEKGIVYIVSGIVIMILALDFMRPLLLANKKRARKPKRRKRK